MSSHSWYSWIPTNLGELNFEYFGKSKDLEGKYQKVRKTQSTFYIKKLDISFISDTYTTLSKWLDPLMSSFLPSFEEEVFGSVDFFIRKQTSYFTAKIRLSYPEYFLAEARIRVGLDGKFKVYDLTMFPNNEELWADFGSQEHFSDYLAQVIFIITKGLLHGDNHHHQKIDTAITINRNKFLPEHIIKNLILHIKRVEHDIKSLDRCYGEIKAKNAVEEMKGYQSYINTFRSIFYPKSREGVNTPKYVSDKSILDNIIASLEANVKKSQNKPAHRITIISTLLVYLAAAVSGAILYINLMDCNYESHITHWGFYWTYLVILLIISIMHLRCVFASWVFYHFYPIYEYLFHITALRNPKGIMNKIIRFFWINKYALMALAVTIALFRIGKYFSDHLN